jgi:cytochrome c-type biogenesis protein CcmH/NrfG
MAKKKPLTNAKNNPNTTPAEADSVKKTTVYGIAALCLAVGFFIGVIFSVYQSGGTAGPGAAAVAPTPANLGNRQRELDDLTRETAQNPKNTTAWTQLGNLYFDTNQFDKAIWAYNKSLALDAGNANVWTDLGVMYRRSGKPREAVRAFEAAMRADPRHEVSRFNKGIVLMHDLNDPEGAVQTWEELLKINPFAMSSDGKSVDELVTAYKQSLKQPKP